MTNEYLQTLCTIAGTIKDCSPAPSGPIYAALLTHKPAMSASEYQEFVDVLIAGKAVSQRNYLLTWLNNPKWNQILDTLDGVYANGTRIRK